MSDGKGAPKNEVVEAVLAEYYLTVEHKRIYGELEVRDAKHQEWGGARRSRNEVVEAVIEALNGAM